MNYFSGQGEFKQYYPRTLPTVTFAGDRRLNFPPSAMRAIGPKVEALEVFVNDSLGILLLHPTKANNPKGLTLAARGEERKEGAVHAKRMSIGGALERLPTVLWSGLKGRSFLLQRTLFNGTLVFLIDLRNPID